MASWRRSALPPPLPVVVECAAGDPTNRTHHLARRRRDGGHQRGPGAAAGGVRGRLLWLLPAGHIPSGVQRGRGAARRARAMRGGGPPARTRAATSVGGERGGAPRARGGGGGWGGGGGGGGDRPHPNCGRPLSPPACPCSRGQLVGQLWCARGGGGGAQAPELRDGLNGVWGAAAHRANPPTRLHPLPPPPGARARRDGDAVRLLHNALLQATRRREKGVGHGQPRHHPAGHPHRELALQL